MKAIVYTQYGPPDLLQLQEVEKPVPNENQVLVKIHAASANALDYRRFESQSLFGRFMDTMLIKAINTVLGADMAGEVEAVGSSVKRFKPGDAVFGAGRGTFAEYACASQNGLALKPANLSFEQAAAVPVAALTALQGLRDKGQIQAGQKVLIQGAGGGVGSFAVQLAKYFGAEVTAVCGTGNLDMVCSIGADHVIDYTQADVTQNGQHYDLIAAVNGYHSIFAYKRILAPGGIYVVMGGSLRQVFDSLLLGKLVSKMGRQKMGMMGIAKINPDDLVFMAGLLEAGKIVSVIDRCYPLSKTVEAIKYVSAGHAKGKVVITMASN